MVLNFCISMKNDVSFYLQREVFSHTQQKFREIDRNILLKRPEG